MKAPGSWEELEARLPRPVKQTLLLLMILVIFSLLLVLESSNNTPFLYIGF